MPDDRREEFVAKGPVLHLIGDETGIWNENARSLGGLDLGRTNADFANRGIAQPCRNLAPRSRANLIGARQRRYLATSAGKEKLR